SSLQLATMDVGSGQIRLISPFPRGRQINPQFSPDGRDLFFIADQDGIPDIYRLNLAGNQTFRLTHAATGISGITSISPAMTVARTTGRMLFTSFYNQGQEIRAFDASQTVGTPVDVSAQVVNNSALPPGDISRSIVSSYLVDPLNGL